MGDESLLQQSMKEIHFNIDHPITAKLSAGYYDVLIVGGFHLDVSKDFDLRVGNAKREVAVSKNYFKTRCFKNWRRAIKYFKFKIEEDGEYHISVMNTQGLQMRKSRLLLARLFQSPIQRNKIEIVVSSR